MAKYFTNCHVVSEWLNTDPVGVDWVIENMLPFRYVATLSGPSGVGKSYLGLQIALSCASGVVMFESFRPATSRVLLLAGREAFGDLHWRARCIANSFPALHELASLADTNLQIEVYQPAVLVAPGQTRPVTTHAFGVLLNKVEEFSPDLVIIDPEHEYYSVDPASDNTVWISALAQLCSLSGCAVLVVGAQGDTSAADVALNLSPLPGPGGRLRLEVTKNRHAPIPPAATLYRGEGGVLLEVQPPARKPKHVAYPRPRTRYI